MQLSLNLDAKLVWACKDIFIFFYFNFTTILVIRDCQSSLSVLISLKRALFEFVSGFSEVELEILGLSVWKAELP